MKKDLLTKSKKTTGISKKKPEAYLKEAYTRILVPEADGTFSAEILEFPGCFSQGNSADEAFRNLEEAAKSWIEAVLDQGQEVPPPLTNQGYNGKIALRLPRSLHRLAMRKAARDGISLNQCLVTAIASWVGADDIYSRYVEKIRQIPMLAVTASATIDMKNYYIHGSSISPSTTEHTAGTIKKLEEMLHPRIPSPTKSVVGMEAQNG